MSYNATMCCPVILNQFWNLTFFENCGFFREIDFDFEWKCDISISSYKKIYVKWRFGEFFGRFFTKIPQKSWLTGQNRNPRPIWLPPFCQMMKQIITIQTFWWTKTDQILSKCTIAHYQRLSSSEYFKNSVKSTFPVRITVEIDFTKYFLYLIRYWCV